MSIAFTAPALVNTTQIGGSQKDVRTATLADGGYVVAWQSSAGFQTTVHFQRHDALGNTLGAMTQVATPGALYEELRDIVASADGTFSILTQTSVGPFFTDLRMTVSSFFGTTGGPTSLSVVTNLGGLGPTGFIGGQLLPDPVSGSAVVLLAMAYDFGFNQDLVRATISTAGVVLNAPVVVAQNISSPAGISEAVQAPGGYEFVITPGTIASTNGTVPYSISGITDILALAPGTYVTAQGQFDSPQVFLQMYTGADASFYNYQVSPGVIATNVAGTTSAGTRSFDTELLDLGGGRILIVWVADAGDIIVGGSFTDGVYAQVYDMNTGGPEGGATLIRGLGTGNNFGVLQSISINADRMADGRVALGLSYSNGLSAHDVFSTILDTRTGGVTLVSATALGETLVGTAFDDTFTGVSTSDRIHGGAGADTVVFGTSAARSVDLQSPGVFPANSFVLSGIENLTGAGNGDILRGDAAANLLTGLAGNDTLTGRDGDDRLFGGTGDDLANAGNGADLLDGSAGIDTLDGGTGDDALFGGADADRLLGGNGDDSLFGGDANDRLQGEAGNDTLFGDAGNDVLSGGPGDDELWGGAGADTLRAEDGADQVYGGADNDRIFAHAGVTLIDGGSGTDTLQAAGPLVAGTTGFQIDLTGVFDQLGTAAVLTRLGADLSGIENVTGGTGGDFITGDGLVNVLRGDAGNDTLVSGLGADVLFGGTGADVFLFAGPTNGADQVRDFVNGVDKMVFLDGAFGDIVAANFGNRFEINATGTIVGGAFAQLMVDNAGAGFGQVFFDADGTGAAAAVLLATLTATSLTGVLLSSADFAII